MSTDLNPLLDDKAAPVIEVTRFNGGIKRGVCIQLTQGLSGTGWHHIHLTKAQLDELTARHLAGELV